MIDPFDPFDNPPWAMQLVVRAEKAAPPSHSAVCEATAMAVLRVLTAAEPEWVLAVQEWESRRIRKVTRRARGIRWREAQELPGVTVDHEGAQVRAIVPGPVDELPPQLAKMQVAGLDLADDEEPKPPPPVPYGAIALNPDVRMSTGKAAAQSGHAAQLLLRYVEQPWSGLRVHRVRDVSWRDCVDRAAVAVRDAGFTEVAPGTMTAIAWLVT